MKAEKKIVILGDMFELEEEAEKEHRNLGKLLTEKKFNRAYLCGKLSNFAKEECASALYFESKELLIAELKMNPMQNSTILVKASRGIGLESVVEYL